MARKIRYLVVRFEWTDTPHPVAWCYTIADARAIVEMSANKELTIYKLEAAQ